MKVLNSFCTMRLRADTTERQVREFLFYIFEGELEPHIEEDLLKNFRAYKDAGMEGRISYGVFDGQLTIKGDNLRL